MLHYLKYKCNFIYIILFCFDILRSILLYMSFTCIMVFFAWVCVKPTTNQIVKLLKNKLTTGLFSRPYCSITLLPINYTKTSDAHLTGKYCVIIVMINWWNHD